MAVAYAYATRVVNDLVTLTVDVVALASLVVALAVFVYVLGSFFLARRSTAPRELGHSVRAMVRETLLAGLTQPLLPVFYLVGHRMDRMLRRTEARLLPGAHPSVPVVFVHGYFQNRACFVGLARELAARGLGPLFGLNYPWFDAVASNAARLERFVERVCVETGSVAVDLVCHSMGGVVAMEMMRDEAKRDSLKVRRCVTIASPHAGVVWRGPVLGEGGANLRRGSQLLRAHAGAKVAVPCLSIYSSHDNVVHPKETSSLSGRGGRDLEVSGFAHLSILFSPIIAEHVAAFLLEPDAASASTTEAAADVPAAIEASLEESEARELRGER